MFGLPVPGTGTGTVEWFNGTRVVEHHTPFGIRRRMGERFTCNSCSVQYVPNTRSSNSRVGAGSIKTDGDDEVPAECAFYTAATPAEVSGRKREQPTSQDTPSGTSSEAAGHCCTRTGTHTHATGSRSLTSSDLLLAYNLVLRYIYKKYVLLFTIYLHKI
jgi:hypothetical protein